MCSEVDIEALFDQWENLKKGISVGDTKEPIAIVPDEAPTEPLLREGAPIQLMWAKYGVVLRAYQQWLKALYPTTPPPLNPHQCSYACEHDVYGDVYFCKESGNMHVCTQFDCNSSIRQYEGSTCSITAKVFSLPLEYKLHSRSADLSSYEPVAKVSVRKRKKRDKSDVKEIKVPPRVVVTRPSKSPSQLKKVVRKKKIKTDDLNKLNGDAVTLLLRICSVIHKPSPPSDVIDRVAQTCCRLWKIISSSLPWNKQSTKYQYANHCCVVIWATINGLVVDGFTVIKQESWMRDNLPVRQFLTTWLGIAQGVFTDTQKFLNSCINNLKENKKLSLLLSSHHHHQSDSSGILTSARPILRYEHYKRRRL
jgi:hypothetical protein